VKLYVFKHTGTGMSIFMNSQILSLIADFNVVIFIPEGSHAPSKIYLKKKQEAAELCGIRSQVRVLLSF
jgi:hypothetical protein